MLCVYLVYDSLFLIDIKILIECVVLGRGGWYSFFVEREIGWKDGDFNVNCLFLSDINGFNYDLCGFFI